MLMSSHVLVSLNSSDQVVQLLPALFLGHLHTCPSWTWLSICMQKINICMLIGYLHILSLHCNDASTHRVWLLALYVVRQEHVVWLHTSIELCSPCTLLGELSNTTTSYTLSHRAHQRDNTAMTMNWTKMMKFFSPNGRSTLPTSILLHECSRTYLE